MQDFRVLFHLAKAFKMKVDKSSMKNRYENDLKFKEFIRHATALSSLPRDKLYDGYAYFDTQFNFNDEKEKKIKLSL